MIRAYEQGWRWCPYTRGYCASCQEIKRGTWLYFVTPASSTACVCESCAEELDR